MIHIAISIVLLTVFVGIVIYLLVTTKNQPVYKRAKLATEVLHTNQPVIIHGVPYIGKTMFLNSLKQMYGEKVLYISFPLPRPMSVILSEVDSDCVVIVDHCERSSNNKWFEKPVKTGAKIIFAFRSSSLPDNVDEFEVYPMEGLNEAETARLIHATRTMPLDSIRFIHAQTGGHPALIQAYLNVLSSSHIQHVAEQLRAAKTEAEHILTAMKDDCSKNSFMYYDNQNNVIHKMML